MRFPFSGKTVIRMAALLALAAGSVVLVNGAKTTPFSKHELAAYADPNLVQYVQPGLTMTVVSTKIANDGTVTVDYKLTDPNGAALDKFGITTPGAISVSFLIAYIPKGQSQYVSYITRTSTGTAGTVTQATGESTGTTTTVATGEYIYTFSAKVPTTFDTTATHRIGLYGNRNLTQWSLGTNYADAWFDFVPAGGTPAPRDIVRTADCSKCHGSATTVTGSNGLAAHGGSRRDVQICIMCHTPQTIDPNTGAAADFKLFIHGIHMGNQLPQPYVLAGNDYSDVTYPSDPRQCEVCHNQKNGASQTANYYKNPNRAACGGCHNDVNFASGQNHVNLPQANDNQCSQCHIPQGELEFDASIKGAHTLPTQSSQILGMNVTLVKVANSNAGQAPTVTFTLKDNKGNPIPLSTLAANSGSLTFVMAGPTTDYGQTSFGSDVTTPGYVSESATTAAICGSDGTCTFTFKHAVPAKATGTFVIGVEGRMTQTLNPGTVTSQSVTYGLPNKVIYFAVDGSKVAPRRTVVAEANCNACHNGLSVHGGLRNDVQYCVICHNPNNTDISSRTAAADKAQPAQAVNFALMAHKIHTGTNLATFGATYVVVGHGGSHNDFGDVTFPTMGPKGTTGDTAQCYMCHTGGSEAVFPIGKLPVTDPQGLMNPAPATTSACTACHLNQSAMAHAAANTDPKYGESCDVCHGAGNAYDVQQVHAGK